MTLKTILEKPSRELTDEGRLIEAGWIGMRIACVPDDASEIQISEMRLAFFAGAQHLFASIMSILEPDAEPTEKDLERISLIDAELRRFASEFELRNEPGSCDLRRGSAKLERRKGSSMSDFADTFARTDEAAYKKADTYRDMVLRRTSLKPEELECPREKSSMTPCIARDGRNAVAFGWTGKPICVGCECSLTHMYEIENAKRGGK
jgi:hypothetical protein